VCWPPACPLHDESRRDLGYTASRGQRGTQTTMMVSGLFAAHAAGHKEHNQGSLNDQGTYEQTQPYHGWNALFNPQHSSSFARKLQWPTPALVYKRRRSAKRRKRGPRESKAKIHTRTQTTRPEDPKAKAKA
jgi:hypothetical protein